jgi:hypothetical protein
MCCLRYEHEFYAQSRKRFPKEGKAMRTKRGEEKVISNDIFRERVTLRGEDGEIRTILLSELRQEAEEVGSPLPVIATAAPAPSIEDEIDEADGLLEETAELPITISSTEEHPIPIIEVAEVAGEPEAKERRPHRRRGRRGGRRNRPGGRAPRDGSSDPQDTNGEN